MLNLTAIAHTPNGMSWKFKETRRVDEAETTRMSGMLWHADPKLRSGKEFLRVLYQERATLEVERAAFETLHSCWKS